jgi:uncharacterized membrane protein
VLVPNQRGGALLVMVDEQALARIAEERDVVIGLVPYIGDFVPHGAPMFRVWGAWPDAEPDLLQANVTMGKDRTMQQDAAFGFRQLVDIPEKALSPGVNDPTTAVQALDQIHDLLRRLARRYIPSGFRYGEDSQLRLVLPRPGWDDYVALGLDEIRQYGSGSLQVMRRIEFMLDDLLAWTPERRRPVLLEQRRYLDLARRRGFQDLPEQEIAADSSAQGHGPGRAKRRNRTMEERTRTSS